MDTTLTQKELIVLAVFINEGRGCNGSTSVEELIGDNTTWCNAVDLQDALPEMTKHEIAGVMSSLDTKSMIADSGDSARGARQTDWYATERGIRAGWDFANK